VGGVVVLIVGVFLLSGINPQTSLLDLNLRMFVVGIGLGPSQSLVNLVVQAAFPMSQIGVATSSTQFFRQIGNTVGVAIFGSLVVLHLTAALPNRLPALPAMSQGSAMQLHLSQAQNILMDAEQMAQRHEAVPRLDAAAVMEQLRTGIQL